MSEAVPLRQRLARSEREQAQEVAAQGPEIQRHDKWRLDDPQDVTKDNLGGSATSNAFAGEETFLQDAASLVKKEQDRKEALLQDALAEEPFNLDLDAQTGKSGSQTSDTESVFTSEQPFLSKVSDDTALPIRWAAHTDKCFLGQASSDPTKHGKMMIWSCTDTSKTSQMLWILPTGNQGHGQIKWGLDQTQCMHVHNGWEGNGNAVYLWPCSDTTKAQSMNFTVQTASNSGAGYSTIAYSSTGGYGTHCLNVKDLQNVEGAGIELWDCASGAMWQIY